MHRILVLAVLCGLLVTPVEAEDGEWAILRLSETGTLMERCPIEVVQMPESPVFIAKECPESKERRTLTDQEAKRFFKLVEAAKLFDGDYVGVDGSNVDGGFTTLSYTRTAKAAILVVSGNPSFKKSGPRYDLIQMLRQLGDTIDKK